MADNHKSNPQIMQHLWHTCHILDFWDARDEIGNGSLEACSVKSWDTLHPTKLLDATNPSDLCSNLRLSAFRMAKGNRKLGCLVK